MTVAKKLQLKEADGAGETGCKLPAAAGPPPEAGSRITCNGGAINLGLGMTVQYVCRNMTMAAFAEGLQTMRGPQLNTPVLDRTGLKGMWNFDIKWSMPFILPIGGSGERFSVPEALEKQLGLKLEEVPVPTAVLVVDSAERTPSVNPPEVAEALPPIPAPTEFEVADVKLAEPDLRRPPRFQMQPGGRLTVDGMPMRFVISRAFNINNWDQIVGLPTGWMRSHRDHGRRRRPSRLPAQSSIPRLLRRCCARCLRNVLGLRITRNSGRSRRFPE